MKYVMLICDDPSNYADLTDQEHKRAYDEIFAHVDKWEKLGRYVDGGKELQGPETAKTIRRDGSGGTVVTDGPYTEIKEQIGGFMVIEADSLEEAIETASEWPTIRLGTSIEVRPIATH